MANLHASSLDCIQQVVQRRLLGLAGKEVQVVQHKNDDLVRLAQLLQNVPQEGQVLCQRRRLAVLQVERPAQPLPMS